MYRYGLENAVLAAQRRSAGDQLIEPIERNRDGRRRVVNPVARRASPLRANVQRNQVAADDLFHAGRMAGLEGYGDVYRGRPVRSADPGYYYSQGTSSFSYYGREVIRPLEIPVVHPLAEDNPPVVDDGESRPFFAD